MISAWGFLGLFYAMSAAVPELSPEANLIGISFKVFFLFSLIFTLIMTIQAARVHMYYPSSFGTAALFTGGAGICVHLYLLLVHYGIGTKTVDATSLIILLLLFLLLSR